MINRQLLQLLIQSQELNKELKLYQFYINYLIQFK